MHWIVCGLLIFAFAAPSAIVGVPYALATQGIAVGIILCLLFTTATMLGAILLVDLKTRYPQCKEFKDLGMQTMGVNGEFWASVVQNGNFFLFLPVAISFVALSAQDVLDPNYEICSDYFIIAVAGICFISTQIRQFKNAELLSMLSGACLAVAAVLILYIVATNDNDLKEPAQWIGNPQHNTTGIVKGLLGVTTAVWSYVPSFLVIEILDEVGMSPTDMVKAIAISAVLNVLVYLVVGLTVVLRWGWDVDDPFTLLEAWPAHSTEARMCSSLLVLANLISYSLDSVALTKKYQVYMMPNFNCDDWGMVSCFRYMLVSSHLWLLAVAIAIFTPNMFVTLAFVTAFTVPWVTLVFPGLFVLGAGASSSTDGHMEPLLQEDHKPIGTPRVLDLSRAPEIISRRNSALIAKVLVALGIVTFFVCLLAAIGKISITQLRGDSIIGCERWRILNKEV